MKKYFSRQWVGCLFVMAGTVSATASLAAQTNVGVSVSVSQPGFYGRVEIGDQPPPVIYAEPVVIVSSPTVHRLKPIYLRVPPGHYKNWKRYCGQYQACNQPVYFVRDSQGYEHGRPDHDDHDEDDHRGGPGNGHGHGHGHGKHH